MHTDSYTYILFNKKRGSLYIGVTSDLKKRIEEHKCKIYEGFTKKYNINKLGYFEIHTDIRSAIEREKALKNLLRNKKIQLIESINPEWKDLFYLL